MNDGAAPIIDEITIGEYLSTVYRPDVDFVDGHLVERLWGEHDHARTVALLAGWFGGREREWSVVTLLSQRVQVAPTRIRISDICILNLGPATEQIVRRPPLICIEVLSPEDSLQRMRERVADYHRMGMENVWLIDPASREGTVCSPPSWSRQEDGLLRVPDSPIYVDLAEIFARLDTA